MSFELTVNRNINLNGLKSGTSAFMTLINVSVTHIASVS